MFSEILSTSTQSVGFSSLVSAIFKTSSAVFTGVILISSITKIPVKREIAMTGEVTITGQVLPIGGLKEKLLAAHRAGIKQVLIPKDNEKNLVDIPKKVIDDIKITPVNTADEVLKIALTKELKPTDWVEVDKISENKKSEKTQASIQ